jgi:hypothetical protein
MMNKRNVFLAATAAALFGVTTLAQANLMVDATVGGAPTGVNYANFDDLALGSTGGTSGGINVSFTPDGKVVQGSQSGQYAAPYLSNSNGTLFGDSTTSGPDATKYLTTGTGSVTLAFGGPQMYLGLLWGSVDDYNTLTFYNGGSAVGSLTGLDVTASANGDQGVQGTFYVNVNSDTAFDRVVATSSQYAFELDNVAYNDSNVSVPEPGTLALFSLGLLGAGVGARRRRKG